MISVGFMCLHAYLPKAYYLYDTFGTHLD
jgi:hypothetical protein